MWSDHLGRLPIRSKFLVMSLVPLTLVLPLLGLLLAWGNMAFDRLLITKVQSDLAVARGYFERVRAEVAGSAAAVADSHALFLVLAHRSSGEALGLLQAWKQREGLDFIALRDAKGRLMATDTSASPDPTVSLPPLNEPPPGRPAAALEILEPQHIALLSASLQARVPVPLLPTLNAAPTAREREDRAMVVLATAPVHDERGAVIGHVQAGVLLNRNLAFIDHINEIVYPEGALPFGSRGTATLFLDDVRISTNVRLFGGETEDRAIGTRVSHTVRDAVLRDGGTWLHSAFVVNDWYVSGYLPLLDGQGHRIGMLYVGFLERPFTQLKYGMLAAIAAIFLGVMLVAAWLSMRAARGIFRPLELMAQTMQRVEGGEPQARVGPLRRADEIGQLAAHLDQLLDVVDQNTRTLQRWNAELDAKVAERTRDLEAAQHQLVRSEKMAAVGQLTASIAHEVNNPIAVLQGNLDLLRELVGPDVERTVGPELALMDAQIERMRLIVTQLLQFARPREFAGYTDLVDPEELLSGCLLLVGHLLSSTRIGVERHLQATRRPAVNRNELQQVLVNLLVNAIQAMDGGGTLGLSTRDHGEDQVVIEVSDTGPGLGPALRSELFKPFVTRKKDGTGLGLWISLSIVERYGGDILAADRTDGTRGAVFTVVLPAEGGMMAGQ